MSTSTKIIYDESTGTMYVILYIFLSIIGDLTIGADSRSIIYRHISGFRMAAPVPSSQKWSNAYYVSYGLAKRSRKTDWYNDETGWEF